MYTKIRNPKCQYDIQLKRRVTIIRGDSGTGKSYLCQLIDRANTGAVHIEKDCKVAVAPARLPEEPEEWLHMHRNFIVFIDESSDVLSTS